MTTYEKDGVVSLSELIHFIKLKTQDEIERVGYGGTITPSLSRLRSGEGEFFFITNEKKISKSKQRSNEDGESSGPDSPVAQKAGDISTPGDLMIREAQQILARLGYKTGPVDGIIGLKTRGALRAFQIDNGIPATGRLDEPTQHKLEVAWSSYSAMGKPITEPQPVVGSSPDIERPTRVSDAESQSSGEAVGGTGATDDGVSTAELGDASPADGTPFGGGSASQQDGGMYSTTPNVPSLSTPAAHAVGAAKPHEVMVSQQPEKPKEGMHDHAARKEPFADCTGCPKMMAVDPGGFMMGSPEDEAARGKDEAPRHWVEIAKPLAVAMHPTTLAEYALFVEQTGHEHGESGCFDWDDRADWRTRRDLNWRNPGFKQTGDHPVTCVNWHDADAYIDWLSKRSGYSYRLLSEAEWEFAARAGTDTPFSTGPNITTAQAEYNGDYPYAGGAKGTYNRRTTASGNFPPNNFGLYDMHGNVWEWVQDCWHENYEGAPADGSAWLTGNCAYRVLRGGAWYNGAADLRSANRSQLGSDKRFTDVGFRVVREMSN